jgi:hypothetical protein
MKGGGGFIRVRTGLGSCARKSVANIAAFLNIKKILPLKLYCSAGHSSCPKYGNNSTIFI